MPVISISIDKSRLKELDSLQKKLEYSGRSELIRSAIHSFVEEKLGDTILDKNESFNASLTVIVPEQGKKKMHDLEQEFSGIIKTHMHQCIANRKCMEVFLLEGKGRKIKGFVNGLEKIPKVENARLVLGA